MSITIIIPVYNQLKFTKLCIKNISKNTLNIDYKILVVDNASSDGTAKFLKRNKISFIYNKKNMGVARAWNQGIKKALSDYVCIINNDIIVSKDWLKGLLDVYELIHNAGIISPGTREGALNYDFDSYAEQYVNKMKKIKEDGFFGWCMIIKKDRFKKIGVFDERFVTGIGEDTDFYIRLKKAGFKSYRTGASFIHHFGSKTLNKVKEKMGNEFEIINIKALNEKWKVKDENYIDKKARSFKNFLRTIFIKLIYGHLLLEKRGKAI